MKILNTNILYNIIIGSQSKRLSEIFKYELLSTGDILRNEIENNGPYADEISNHINVGELVPDVSSII